MIWRNVIYSYALRVAEHFTKVCMIWGSHSCASSEFHLLGYNSFFTLVSWLLYSSILKMQAIRSAETSVDFQWNTRWHIPEDRTLHFTRNSMHLYLKLNQILKVNFISLTHSLMELNHSWEVANCAAYSRTSQHFLEPESSLPCSQEPSTDPYPYKS
jgi:hypothetical protein